MSYIGQRPVVGRYIKLDQISSGFNGSNTGFSMTAGSQAVFPGTARNLLLSLGGVIQEPDTDFTISGSTLTFTTPPVANTTFFGVIYGDMQATGTPSDGTVLPASIASSGHFKIPQLTVNEDGADVDFRVEGDTDANLLFVDASTDRIGIGTNSPTSPLEISHASNPVIKVTSTSSSVGAGFFAQGGSSNDSQFGLNSGTTAKYTFLRDGSQSDDLRIYDSANALDIIRYRHGSYLHFGVNGSERMRINSSGNVGIGTTSPTHRLHVIGDGSNNLPLKYFRGGSGVSGYLYSDGGGSGIVGSDGNLNNTGLYFVNDTSVDLRVNGSARLLINSSGDVGIGTSSPSQRLEVSGNLKVTAGLAIFDNDQRIQWGTSNVSYIEGNDDSHVLFGVAAERMRLTGTGLGIGTSSPSANLHLKDGSGNTEIKLQGGASTANDIIAFLNSAGTTRGNITYDTDNDFLLFNVNTSERMRIKSDGDIQLTRPTAGTGVNETLLISANYGSGSDQALQASNSLRFYSGGANERIRIKSDGDVLIGTTTSAGKLTVDSGTSNTCATFQSSDAGAGINLKDNNARSSIEQNGTDLKISSDTGAEDANSTIKLQIDGSTKMRINSDGNTSFNGSAAVNCAIDIEGNQVDIGNPLGNGVSNGINPTFRALVTNKNILFSSMWGGDNQIHKHIEFSGGANIFYVGTDDSEIARTDGTGMVIGSTSFDSNNSIGIRLFAHGAIHSTRDSEYAYVGRRSNSNGGMFLFRRDSTDVGNISVTTSATSYNSGSDYRLKQDDTPLIDGLTRLKQLKPIKFKWKNDTSQFVDGFFAHEVSSIVPNAITGEKDAVYKKDDELGHKKGDPIYQQIDHGKLVPLLVAALQEEIVKREELEARVAALEAA